MRFLALLAAVGAAACDREPDGERNQRVPAPATFPSNEVRQSRPAQLLPLPTDEAERDRLILAGYTPHADHLHPPGVKSCPLAQGKEAVM